MRLTEEELIRELRDERPEVDPEFGRALDDWAAAGFPRGGPGGPDRLGIRDRVAQGMERAREKLASTPPRRLIAPVGAAATLFVVAGIAISQSGAPEQGLTVAEPQPVEEPSIAPSPPVDAGAAAEGTEEAAPSAAQDADAFGLEGGSGGDAARQRDRGRAEIALDARLVLGSEPDEVQDVANGVNEVTNRHRGYVVNSNVESGEDSLSAGAHFRLRIPANNLQAALADLSELADVQSRNEGTQDITGRFVSAENQIERLERARTAAERDLAEAEADGRDREVRRIEQTIEQLELELDAEERSLAEAEQRVDLVPVDVQIVTDTSGEWGFEDALDDAGEALTTIGGGLLVAGAVIAPFALLGGIAYAINRRRVSRARDRALD